MMARATLIALLLLPTTLRAQDSRPWTLRLSAIVSGSSYESDPAGYKVYSGVSLEGGVARTFSDVVSIELSARTESREVNGPPLNGTPERLGSIELLPVNLVARWHPLGRTDRAVQPGVGFGVNFTATWEKSGALDSSHPTPSWSPLVQGSTDIRLSERTVLKLDVKWHLLKIEIEDSAPTAPIVSVDPLILGLGVEVGL